MVPCQKVYKSKGLKVKRSPRSPSQKFPSQKVPGQKVYKNLMSEIKEANTTRVGFWPSWHNVRDILAFLDNFYFSNLSFQILWLISGMEVIKNTNFITFLQNEAHSNNKF